MRRKAATKSRQQPPRSCKSKSTLTINHTPPLLRIPPELRNMIYTEVAQSTLSDAKTFKTKLSSATLGFLRVSKQIRGEAKSICQRVLMEEVNRSRERTNGLFAVSDMVRKRFILRLWNLPGACNDRIGLRLDCLISAFLMVIEERRLEFDVEHELFTELYLMEDM